MGAEIIIVILLSWIELVFLQAFIHHFLIHVLKVRPRYFHWVLMRGGVAIFHISIFYFLSIWIWAIIFGFILTSHFAIYNPFLNFLRHFKQPEIKFWYLGKDSGWFDKFFLGDLILYKGFYFLCCALVIIFSTIIFNIYG